MTTQLKPGTLAQIKKSEGHPECMGWIVTVIRPTLSTVLCSDIGGVPCSRISHAPLGPHAMTESDIPTAWLRPIRGDDQGEDETLQWAGKPSEQQQEEPAQQEG